MVVGGGGKEKETSLANCAKAGMIVKLLGLLI